MRKLKRNIGKIFRGWMKQRNGGISAEIEKGEDGAVEKKVGAKVEMEGLEKRVM